MPIVAASFVKQRLLEPNHFPQVSCDNAILRGAGRGFSQPLLGRANFARVSILITNVTFAPTVEIVQEHYTRTRTSRRVSCNPLIQARKIMQSTPNAPFTFRFHWLNQLGHPTSMFSKKGSFDGETVVLEKSSIPVAAIVESVTRQQILVLSTFTGDDQQPVVHLILKPSSQSVTKALKKKIDIARSKSWAQHHRDELSNKGQAHRYRDFACPHCSAVTVLTEFPETPQFYCRFCQSLSTIGSPELMKEEKGLKICDECGMYSRPKEFTIFYFYFLLVIYGWWYHTTWRCPACMRADAWKMLFGNLLFIVGVPIAIIQLVRAYGSESMGGQFKGLNAANIRACKGDANGAFKLYQVIMERVPSSAGLKYNLATALLRMKDIEKATQACELSLCDCSSYAPAYHLLRELYSQTNASEKLREIDNIWSHGEEPDAALPESKT